MRVNWEHKKNIINNNKGKTKAPDRRMADAWDAGGQWEACSFDNLNVWNI